MASLVPPAQPGAASRARVHVPVRARRHNAKTGKCAVCEQSTGGTFNVAHDVVKRMNKAKRA